MINKRTKITGKSENSGSFSMLVHAFFQSPEYAELSPRAVKLLIDLFCQYRGKNNGDLCAAFSVMKKAGWTSNDQLQKALAELLAKGWILVVRAGGRRQPTLYAVTVVRIDDTKKLDSHVKLTGNALHLWKTGNRKDVVLNPTMERIWEKISKQTTSSCRSGAFCPPAHGTKAQQSMLH